MDGPTKFILDGPDFVERHAGHDATELLAETGGNYRVGIGRWFGAAADGKKVRIDELADATEPSHVVLCDRGGRPVNLDIGPIVARVLRPQGEKDWSKCTLDIDWQGSNHRIRLARSTRFHMDGHYFVLDKPADDTTSDEFATESGHVLPENYACADFSQRATLGVWPNGEIRLLGLVGSRYTVLQNSFLAEDAVRFLNANNHSPHSVRLKQQPYRLRGGASRAFYGLEMALEGIIDDDNRLSDEAHLGLMLMHSHDRRYTYTHLWSLRDGLVDSQPILARGTIKIKHTKKIEERANLVGSTLEGIQTGIAKVVEQRELLRHHDLGPDDSVDRLLNETFRPPQRMGWLVGKMVRRFEDAAYAPTHGRNLWTVYRAVCAIEGEYWDDKVESSGLPALLEVSDAYRRREKTLERLLALVEADKSDP